MTKAEKYIQDHTRECSNTEYTQGVYTPSYHPWLTPDQAKRAVEIAKEEAIEKACEWLKENVTYTHPRKGTTECIVNLTAFKEAMGLTMANYIRLEQTCECCPEQYWAYKGSRIIGYIRLRWGHLTCDYLPNGRQTDDDIKVLVKVFNERTDDQYKGSFDTEEEREYWLGKCKEALLNKYNELNN